MFDEICGHANCYRDCEIIPLPGLLEFFLSRILKIKKKAKRKMVKKARRINRRNNGRI